MQGKCKKAIVTATLAGIACALGPGGAASADDVEDRILKGAAQGVLEEFLGDVFREGQYKYDGYKLRSHGVAIPEGHYPPPGSCRIWYPDRPAGHQPPPTSCGVPIPHGAFLIHG